MAWQMCACSVRLIPSTYWHTSADLCTSYLSSFDCLDQFEGLSAAVYSHQQITRQTKVNMEEQICGSGFNTDEG